jgi:hypothetical protein
VRARLFSNEFNLTSIYSRRSVFARARTSARLGLVCFELKNKNGKKTGEKESEAKIRDAIREGQLRLE